MSRKIDPGLTFGGGCERVSWIVEARHTWGPCGDFEIDSHGRFRNRSVAVTAGYRFRRD